MSKLINLTGKTYGNLVVIKINGRNEYKQIIWECRCKCGNIIDVPGYRLRYNQTKSCGCLKRKRLITHGSTNTHIYNTWWNMKRRCYNQNNPYYKNYGGRGIKVCDEWLNDFTKFKEWSLSNGYTDTLTLDRKDVNGDYEPNNCRWVNNVVQQNNRRNNRYITYNNQTKTIAQWCRIIGIPRSTLYKRLFILNWSIERAFGEGVYHEKIKNN